MLKNDKWIREMASKGMITPFEPSLVREVENKKVLSYGCSSFGYDLRLSPVDFRIFRHIPGKIVNPKRFNPQNLEHAELQSDEDGDFFVIPGNSYALGVAMERLEIPNNITCLFLGKSSYARCFTGDTKVKLVDGDYSFLELIEKSQRGEKLFGFGILDNQIIVQELVNPMFIENSEIVRIHLDDGSFVDCTPDHQFLLRSGSWVEARHLKERDSLRSVYQHQTHGYPTIYDSVKADNSKSRAEGWSELHHLVWDCLARKGIANSSAKGWHVHHIDGNKLNAHPSNLELLSPCEHASLHNQEDLRHLKGGMRFKELFESNQSFREHICTSLHSDKAKAKRLEASQEWLYSGENKSNLDTARSMRWSDIKQKTKQSEVAKNGMAALKRRNDITQESLTQALLKTGSIRGASKLLNVDRSAFRRFPDVMQKFRAGELQVNHKVVKVEKLKTIQPTYCLTATETGDFALSSGVFVKNCGVIANLTPGEAGWKGHLTLEFSNSAASDCRIYCQEGVIQALFFEGHECDISYEKRQGKYQNQSEQIVMAKV